MYESFFGLNEKPFNLTPDPRYFYLSEGHREALAALIYGVRERAGLIALTGPVGVGKTMILASFLDQIRDHSETASFSGEVSLNRMEFLEDLCTSLGIPGDRNSLFGVSQVMKDFAVRKAGEGRSVVVLVDEAQDLGLQELEHFHHLSNLETAEAKLFQIVLAGTEKLDEKLRDRSMEALWQRVAIRCAIKPIGPEETIAYISHRLRVAGSGSSGLFSEDALWRIVSFACGVPRLINLVCNQAMISAYSAGRLPVDEDAVLEALSELEAEHSRTGAEHIVGRDEIRGTVETVSLYPQEGATSSEQGWNPGANEREESRGKVEAGQGAVIADWRTSLRGFFSSVVTGRRIPVALVVIILLAAVGIVLAIGLLKAKDDEVERVDVSLLKRPDAGWQGGASEEPGLEVRAPRGVPGETAGEKNVPESRSGLTALGRSEVEEVQAGSGGALHRAKQDSRQGITPSDGVPTRAGKRMVRETDIAGIALENYGRLDVEMLRVFREKNPQIRDWNNLTRNVQLVLPDEPDMPAPKHGGVDFYTIQVGAFRDEQGASRRASDLAKKGAQNLFLVKGGGDEKITFVCVGVFESERQSSGGIGRVHEWGFGDAFPTRIKEKRLEDILTPYAGSGVAKPPMEERHADASGFPLERE